MINQHWVFGLNAELDFSTAPPTPSAGRAINTGEGCASISDANGNLILYTDGQTVWEGNVNNTVRAPIGTPGLNGNSSSTQSAIIVPDPNPGNPAGYYIFTGDGLNGNNNHVDGIRIDTSSWTVTQLSLATSALTTGFSSTEKVTAIRHANCKDFWVATIVQTAAHGDISDGQGTFRVFLVDSTGVTHIPDTPMNANVDDVGYLKGSTDGKRIAVANWGNHNVLVYPFDNSTGAIDTTPLNLINISVPPNLDLIPPNPNHRRLTYGVEFSPNNNILYYSVIGDEGQNNIPDTDGYVFQHDLLNPFLASFQVGRHPNGGGWRKCWRDMPWGRSS